MATELTNDLVRGLLPERPEGAHKGTFGHLFALVTSRGFTGAGGLVAHAAERSGVGLVTVGIPAGVADVAGAMLVESMTRPLPCTEAETFAESAVAPALAFAANKTAVALGPGISRHPETVRFVDAFVRQCPVPLVVDADGLNCLSEDMSAAADREQPAILTPHPGEMARLTGKGTKDIQQNREGAATELARQTGCIVVLKGCRTVIAVPEGGVFINSTGNQGLATGGTGDVLTGLMGGFLAQKTAAADAAKTAVYVHGLAGDIAAARMTPRAMKAGDVIDALPEAFRRLEAR